MPETVGGSPPGLVITKVRTTSATVPRNPELVIVSAIGVHAESAFVLVEVEAEAGLLGLGEATVSVLWSGETQGGARAVIDEVLAPAMIGRDAGDIEGLARTLDRAAVGNPFAKAACEMACWDLVGKALGLPVYRVLGGPSDPPPIPIKFVLAAREPDVVVPVARKAIQRGFSTLKVKVGGATADDVARVRAVREAVGPGVALTVDANGGWTPRDAARAIEALAPLGVALVEQPVPRWDIEGLSWVRARSPLPVMADEAVFTPQDALRVVSEGAADVVSVYPGKHGGIRATQAVIAICEAAGVPCCLGSNLEWDVASAAMAHLAAASPNVRSDLYPADLIGPLYHTARLVIAPLVIEGGLAHVPRGPGLGVELDPGQVARYRVGGAFDLTPIPSPPAGRGEEGWGAVPPPGDDRR